MYADVILPLPLEGFFTYQVPEDLSGKVRPGMRVVVPLAKSKTYVGIVAEIHDRQPDFVTRPLTALCDAGPVLLDTQLRLWKWMAEYYM